MKYIKTYEKKYTSQEALKIFEDLAEHIRKFVESVSGRKYKIIIKEYLAHNNEYLKYAEFYSTLDEEFHLTFDCDPSEGFYISFTGVNQFIQSSDYEEFIYEKAEEYEDKNPNGCFIVGYCSEFKKEITKENFELWINVKKYNL